MPRGTDSGSSLTFFPAPVVLVWANLPLRPASLKETSPGRSLRMSSLRRTPKTFSNRIQVTIRTTTGSPGSITWTSNAATTERGKRGAFFTDSAPRTATTSALSTFFLKKLSWEKRWPSGRPDRDSIQDTAALKTSEKDAKHPSATVSWM